LLVLPPDDPSQTRLVIALQELLCQIAGQEDFFRKLDIDLTEEKFRQAAKVQLERGYFDWVSDKVSFLHNQITEWFITPTVTVQTTSGFHRPRLQQSPQVWESH